MSFENDDFIYLFFYPNDLRWIFKKFGGLICLGKGLKKQKWFLKTLKHVKYQTQTTLEKCKVWKWLSNM